jgi:hypothetical protein
MEYGEKIERNNLKNGQNSRINILLNFAVPSKHP